MSVLLAIGIALAVLFLMWLYAIAPQMQNRPDLSEFAKYDYAHRGLHNNPRGIPENSLKSFRLAAESGFGIELDLQLTKDNRVIVHHDDNLARLSGKDMRISDLTLDELRQYKLLETDEFIPTFEETLDAVGRRVPLIIEIKTYSPAALICPLVWDILKDYEGLYCVQSFDPLIVKWFRDNQPQVVRGQLMENLQKNWQFNRFEAFAGRNLCSNFLARPNFEAYDYHARKRPAMWLARNMFGMQEFSWTVRDWDTYHALKKENCIIIFEGFEPFADAQKVSAGEEKAKAVNGAPAPVANIVGPSRKEEQGCH